MSRGGEGLVSGATPPAGAALGRQSLFFALGLEETAVLEFLHKAGAGYRGAKTMEQVLRRLAFSQQYVGHLSSLYRNWITVNIGYYSIVPAGVSTGPVNIRRR